MANYYASRGWVFVSIDYRTSQVLGVIEGMSPKEILTYYRGIVPEEWIENALEGAQSLDQFKQAIAMYLAQRDANWMGDIYEFFAGSLLTLKPIKLIKTS